MKRTFGKGTLMLAVLATTVMANGSEPEKAVVLAPVINMYSAPRRTADVVSQAVIGSNLTELKKKHKWIQVQTPDHYSGWVEAKRVRALRNGGYADGQAAQVSSLFANIYEEKDVTTHAPMVTVPFEARLELASNAAGNDERWLAVRLPDGRSGWIQRGDVTLAPKTLTIPESIELAKRFLGIPYLWGGRSSFGYDCSGFTQMLVRSRGINMPRDADQQAVWDGSVEVKRADLEAGDLLFFGESAQKITHTGMYIGNGQFIHDTTHSHPVVQISRLDDEPWTNLLVAARRVK